MAKTRKQTSPKPTPAAKRGPGAPKGSANALRHGLKCGQLPKDAKYVEYRLNQFRRTLEAALQAAGRDVGIPEAAAIQTCVRWERHACLAQRWLNKMQDQLKPEQRLTFSREIARASTERDKALAALHLDRDQRADAIDALYALPAPDSEGKDNDEAEPG